MHLGLLLLTKPFCSAGGNSGLVNLNEESEADIGLCGVSELRRACKAWGSAL